jgi:hypothetical protein
VLKSGKTGKDGDFFYNKPKDFYNNLNIELVQGNDRFSTSQYAYGYSEANPPSTRTFLFTDRSIYRPGQTVFFKGITIKTKGNGKDNELLTGSPHQRYFLRCQ